jgi:hypothetical protein
MTPRGLAAPSLFETSSGACPRCDGAHVIALAVDLGSAFAWHECQVCQHLWALPQGWTPHAGPDAAADPR